MKHPLSWIYAAAKPSSLMFLVLAIALIGPLVDIHAALAATSTGTWIDRGDVSYNGEVFTTFKLFGGQRSPVDTNMALNGTNTCTPTDGSGAGTTVTDNMTITNFYNKTPDKVSVTTYQLQGSQQHGYDCVPTTVTITMTNSYYSVGGAAQATWTVSVFTLSDPTNPATARYDYQISYDGLPFISTLPAFNSMTLVGPTGCIHNGVLSPDSLRISNVSTGLDALVQLENSDGKGGCVAAPAQHATLTNTYNDITPGINASWAATSDVGDTTSQQMNVPKTDTSNTPTVQAGNSTASGGVMTLSTTVSVQGYRGGGQYTVTVTVGNSSASYLDSLTAIEKFSGPSGTGGYYIPIKLVAALNTPADSSGGSGSGAGNGITCSLSTGIDWLFCPLMNIGISAIDGVGKVLSTFLYTPTDQVFTPQFQTVFNTFRNIGIALLVIVGLIMVASQAAGLELFAAYTVRKALPRIVIAAIGMAVAWPILLFVITFFNDLGTWANQLIVSTVSSTSSGSSLGSFNGGSILELIIGGAAGATYLIVIGGAGVALSLIGTLLLALLIGFFVLAIRQMVILVAVLIAPLAIAMSVLPGTATLWNFWRKSLITALVMFPLIMAFLGAGEALSSIATTASVAPGISSGQAGTWKFVAIIALIAPLAMLPSAFTLAGGIMSTVMGLATGNKFVKGAFENAAKYRQTKRAENWNKTKAGIRFAGNNPLSKLVNTAGGEVGSFIGSENKLGYFRPGVRKAAREQNMAMAAGEYARNPRTAATMFNDNMLRAQTYASAQDARAGLARDFGLSGDATEQAIRDAQVNGGFGGARARYAAQQLAVTGTGYANIGQVTDTVRRVAGGNASSIDAMTGLINSETKKAGRHDLAAGAANLSNMARSAAGLGLMPGTTSVPTMAEAQEAAWNSASLYQHANDKVANVDNNIANFAPMLTSANAADRERAAVFFNELRAMQPNASGGVKNAIQTALQANRADIDALYDPTNPLALANTPGATRQQAPEAHEVPEYDARTGQYGTRTVYTPRPARAETARERVERLSRTYERPDPNNM